MATRKAKEAKAAPEPEEPQVVEPLVAQEELPPADPNGERFDDEYCAKLCTAILERARVFGRRDPDKIEVVFKRVLGERAVYIRDLPQ